MSSTNQPDNSNSSFSSLSSKFINIFKYKINSIKRSKVSTTVPYSLSDVKTIGFKLSKSLTDNSKEIKSTNNNRRNSTTFDIQNCWIDEEDDDEFSEKDLMPSPSVLFNQNDIYLSVISKTRSLVKPIKTNIVRGSLEHFAYIRTLRKIRERQRPLNQIVTLNSIINKLSETSEFPEFQREELRQYKIMVYETSKRNFSCGNSSDLKLYSAIKSTTTLCASESGRIDTSVTIKNKLLAEYHTGSPIVMKYRPSYVTTKVVTVFDDKLNQFVVRDLPLARKKKRLSKSSISSNTTLVRNSSSNSSTSSLSSLTTLNDPFEDVKFFDDTLEFPKFKDKQQNDDDEEDNVPLFVLKEQFKYSGRGCGTTSQKSSSLIIGENGDRLTLTV